MFGRRRILLLSGDLYTSLLAIGAHQPIPFLLLSSFPPGYPDLLLLIDMLITHDVCEGCEGQKQGKRTEEGWLDSAADG